MKLKQKHPLVTISYFLASGFGSGLSPIAPGTAGSALMAVLSYFYFINYGEPSRFGYLFFLGTICLISLFLIEICIQNIIHFTNQDPQEIVIDEFCGFLIALQFCPWSTYNLITGFILFRIFDIKKPWIIKRADNTKGSLGILLDDILAGVFTGVCLLFITKI